MVIGELPLIIFTILVQWSVGVFIGVTCFQQIYLKNKVDRRIVLKVEYRKQYMTISTMVLALVASLFHLGDPFGGYRAIYNLFSSWLSREVLFAGLFFVLLGLRVLLQKRYGKIQKIYHSNYYDIFICIVGIFEIISMASVYTTTIIPAWSHFYTYVLFFGATIVFGTIGTLLSTQQVINEIAEAYYTWARVIVILALAILVQVVLLPFYLNILKGGSSAGLSSYQLITNTLSVQYIARWVLSIVASGLLYIRIRQHNLSSNLLRVCATILIISELLGRITFYEIGTPTTLG